MYEAHKWLSNVVSVHKNAADLMKKRKMDNRWKEETHTQKNTWIKNANSEKKRIQIHSSSVFNFQINNTNKFRFYCQRSRVESEHSNKYSLKLNNETHEMKSFLQQKLHSKWESEKRMKETERKKMIEKGFKENTDVHHVVQLPHILYFIYYVFFPLSFSMSLPIACYRNSSNFSKQQILTVLFFFTLLSFVSSIVRYDKRHDFFLVQQKLSLFFFLLYEAADIRWHTVGYDTDYQLLLNTNHPDK